MRRRAVLTCESRRAAVDDGWVIAPRQVETLSVAQLSRNYRTTALRGHETISRRDPRAASARFKGSDVNEWTCHGSVILDLPIDSVLPFIGDGTAREAGPSRTILESGSWSWGSLAASFGRFETPMEVIGPPELRDAFATLADRYKTTATA